jgi:intein/homing endonuclease
MKKYHLRIINLEKWDKRKVPIATKIPYKIIDCPELTEDICKIIGHYIAEGWVIKSSKKRHRTYTSGYVITEEIIPILEKLNTPIREFKNKNGVPCIEFLNGNINTILQDIKDDSFNIHLPEKYFHLPENKIRALLNGYFIVMDILMKIVNGEELDQI